MEHIDTIKRISNKLGRKHKTCYTCCRESYSCCMACLLIIGILLFFAFIVFVLQHIQLFANHIIFSSTHNFTNGCPLGVETCNRILGFDKDFFLSMFFNPEDKIGCIDFDDFFDGACSMVAVINFGILFIVIILIIGMIMVCFDLIKYIYSFFFDAVEIYQEEVTLAEIKVA